MNDPYAKSRKRFEEDTCEHQLSVIRDDGLYRHLRCNAPGTYIYGFDLVAWPGYLAIVGDAGDYVFSRVRDMFEFFESESGWINPQYWAEKLQGPGHDMARSYSHERLRERVHAWARDYWEYGDGWDMYLSLLLETLDRELLSGWTRFEEEGRDILHSLEDEVGQQLEAWEWDLRDFDHRFLWCCHAIVWGIQQYRALEGREPVEPALTWLLTNGPLKGRSVEIHQRATDDPTSPWMTADALGDPRARFAIWRSTGAVHRVQEEGDEYPEAVEDDPIWTPSTTT